MSDILESRDVAKRAINVVKNRSQISVKQVVEAIEYDILDRRGLKNEWSRIDESVRDEIKEVWLCIIIEGLNI